MAVVADDHLKIMLMHMDHDDGHGHSCATGPQTKEWRRILWIALIVNAVMFFVEIGAGLRSDSSSLLADALDFFGDATNYAISLLVVGAAFAWQTRAAFIKGFTLVFFGLWIILNTARHAYVGTVPEAHIMGVIGFVALMANVSVAILLYKFRDGDANMRSVWLCTRNDAIGNVAVLFAAAGVFGTTTGYPDFVVAAILSSLSVSAGWQTLRQALREHHDHKQPKIQP